MPQISKYVRDGLKAHLADLSTGFNARLDAVAADYGIESWAVDWSDTSTNFIFGRVQPVQFESSSVLTYPLVTIEVARSQNTNRVKFQTFSGPVVVIIDIHHSWPDASVLSDFASWLDATEDAMIACINDHNQQSWPAGLLWGGQVAAQRGPIQMAGENWLQTLTVTCQFELQV